MSYDIIIYGVIAALLFWRLFSMLGQYGGDESKARRYDRLFQKIEESVEQKVAGKKGGQVDIIIGEDGQATPLTITQVLQHLKNIDPRFSEANFLRGARIAFHTIVKAMAEGKREELKPLLDEAIYQDFIQVLDARSRAGEVLENIIVRLRDPAITGASIQGDQANLTVTFMSEQIHVVRDQSGKVIDGDPDRIYDVTDNWTFSRQIQSPDPNWRLTATASAA
ncbi:MAG: Tim44/TimA family putative adaptor protein [Dongiaceae bacterium]